MGGTADGEDDTDAEDDADIPDVKKNKPRDKNDTEPLLFHSPPAVLVEEIMHSVDPVAVIALAGDGRVAELCLERRIPFFGLCFTPEHVTALTARLEARVFSRMQNDKSRLYSPTLKVILDKNQNEPENNDKAEPKPAPKPKPKGPKRKKEEGGAEEKVEETDQKKPRGAGKGKGKTKNDKKDDPATEGASAGASTHSDVLAELKKLATSAIDS